MAAAAPEEPRRLAPSEDSVGSSSEASPRHLPGLAQLLQLPGRGNVATGLLKALDRASMEEDSSPLRFARPLPPSIDQTSPKRAGSASPASPGAQSAGEWASGSYKSSSNGSPSPGPRPRQVLPTGHPHAPARAATMASMSSGDVSDCFYESSETDEPDLETLPKVGVLQRRMSGIEACMIAHGSAKEGEQDFSACSSTDTAVFLKRMFSGDAVSLKGVRGLAAHVVASRAFNLFFALLVLLSSCLMTLETNARAEIAAGEADDRKLRKIIFGSEVLEEVFLVLFTLEMALRCAGNAYGYPWKDGWLLFDGTVLIATALDIWVLRPLAHMELLLGVWPLRLLSVFRALRALRILRVLKLVAPMHTMVTALGWGFWAIWPIVFVTVLFQFCLAVFFTVVIGGLPRHDGELEEPLWSDLFASTSKSMFVVTLVMVHEVQWGQTMVWPLGETTWRVAMAKLIETYVMVYLVTCLVKFISAIFVTTFIDASTREEARESCSSLYCSMGKLRELFFLLAKDSNVITLEHFTEGLKTHREVCRRYGVDSSKAAAYFRFMDTNGSMSVSLDEFLTGFLKIAHSSRPSDYMSIDHQLAKIFKDLYNIDQDLDRDMELIEQQEKGVNERYDGIMQTMGKLTQTLHCSRGGTGSRASALLQQQALEERKADRQHVSVGSPLEMALSDLEEKFFYKQRLYGLQGQLKEKREAAEKADAKAAQSPALAMNEIFLGDVLPWLRRRAPRLSVASSCSAEAAAAAPTSGARRPKVASDLPSVLGSAFRPFSGKEKSLTEVVRQRRNSQQQPSPGSLLSKAALLPRVTRYEAAEREQSPAPSRPMEQSPAPTRPRVTPPTQARVEQPKQLIASAFVPLGDLAPRRRGGWRVPFATGASPSPASGRSEPAERGGESSPGGQASPKSPAARLAGVLSSVVRTSV